MDLTQEGANVVATGSGAIDLTGLSFFESRTEAAGLLPSINFVMTGPVNAGVVHLYSGINGPSNFGSGGFTAASSGSGDRVGIGNDGKVLFVPLDYVSDSSLSDTSTYAGKTFSKFTSADKERQLEDALMLEDPVTDLTIAMEINYFQFNRAEYFVPIVVKIPGRELALAKRGVAQLVAGSSMKGPT